MKRLGVIGVVAMSLGATGCPDPTAQGTDVTFVADAALDATGDLDSGQAGETVAPTPDTAAADVAVDTGPPPPTDPCDIRCSAYTGCGAAVVDACTRTCDDAEVAACEDACLEADQSCTRAEACFDVVSVDDAVPWNTGPYGSGYRDTADEFVLPTLRGDWSFAERWTGQDSYVFAMTQTAFPPGQQLWSSQAYWWLDESPLNVHYFFMSYHDADGVDDALNNVANQKLLVDSALVTIGQNRGKPIECHWRRRVHYVSVSGWSLGNWMGAMLQQTPVLSFAIDRYQKLRPVGLLSLVNGTPELKHLQYPPTYYNFERQRELEAWKGDTTTVTVFDQEAVNGQTVLVELPSAAEMATFDTLELDIRQYCDAHDDQNCFEWDYKAYIEVRERPVEATNADATTACQAEVTAVAEVIEVMGTCPDGATPCATDGACGAGEVCTGYQAPVAAVDAVAAETLACDCVVPGQSAPRASQKVCLGDGTGYGDCQCDEAWEVVRWITTYNREGRWVVDASPFLPLFDSGATTRIHFKGSYPYVTTLHLNFSNRGKADRAVAVHKLFTGGGFGPDYSKDKAPIAVPIPVSTKRAEVVAFITGHGFGGQPHNCAEFCNHTHHFTVNGMEYVQDQPYVGDYYGCAKQVPFGTVPNQYGTWTIGRGGWCPGLEVRPFIADVSEVMGANADISYGGRLNGVDWQDGDPTYGGSIWMSSFLVTYE